MMLEDFLDDLALIEAGQSKEVLRDELYVPCHRSRGWIRCVVSVDRNQGYRLYLESTRRCLLSAKRFGQNIILISMSEDFTCHETLPKRGYIAKVIRHKDSSFHVCLTSCRFCDNKLGCFTCGRGPGQREIVAKVVHSLRTFKSVKAEMRCLSVTIPPVSNSGKRAIWCPRFLRIQDPTLPMSADVNEALVNNAALSMKFSNRLPAWSKDLECLVLKFHGNRILCSSSKNFLLQCDAPVTKPRKSKHAESTKDRDEDCAVMQFGKSSASTYVLDFKFPLSPIQAFGIALTVFCRDDFEPFSVPQELEYLNQCNSSSSNYNNNNIDTNLNVSTGDLAGLPGSSISLKKCVGGSVASGITSKGFSSGQNIAVANASNGGDGSIRPGGNLHRANSDFGPAAIDNRSIASGSSAPSFHSLSSSNLFNSQKNMILVGSEAAAKKNPSKYSPRSMVSALSSFLYSRNKSNDNEAGPNNNNSNNNAMNVINNDSSDSRLNDVVENGFGDVATVIDDDSSSEGSRMVPDRSRSAGSSLVIGGQLQPVGQRCYGNSSADATKAVQLKPPMLQPPVAVTHTAFADKMGKSVSQQNRLTSRMEELGNLFFGPASESRFPSPDTTSLFNENLRMDKLVSP